MYKYGILFLPATPSIILPRVVTPAIDTLSKFVCPSTSISALMSKLPPKVETPVTLNDFVVEELDTFISTASIGQTSYLSVPVPTTPFNSLLTNSIQLPAWAKYPLP